MAQNTELIDKGGVNAPVIVSRRTSNRNQGHNEHRSEDSRTSRRRGPQESGSMVRGALKGWELDSLFMKADHRGVYKRFLVWGWLVPACLLVPCAHLNILLMVYLPPSNCTLPTPPRHLSYEDWRSFATPRTPKGELDSCALYDFPAALKDPQYDPGIHKQYNTITSYKPPSNQPNPGTSAEPPGTPHDTSTPKEDTGTFENVPVTADHPGTSNDTSKPTEDSGIFYSVPATTSYPDTIEDTSIPEEEETSTLEYVSDTTSHPDTSEDTSKPEEDTGTVEDVPGFSDQSYTLGRDTSSLGGDPGTSEHLGIPQHTRLQPLSIPKPIIGDLEQHQLNTSEVTIAPEYTHALDTSTPKHINTQLSSTPEDVNTQEQQTSTQEDSITQERHLSTSQQQSDTFKQDSNTPEEGSNTSEQHITTHGQTHSIHTPATPSTQHDPAKSRVARSFDPFDDLFDPRKVKVEDHTRTERKEDLMEEYQKAAITWLKYYPRKPPPSSYTKGCVFGYDFDKTYVQESLSMHFGWACGESQGITRILHVSMAGNVIGSILFGALADRVGRKWIFMLLAVKVAVLGSLFVLVGGTWSLMMLRFLVALGLPAIYQIMIITALEQVRERERGLVTSLSSVCFSLGQCLLALIAWLTGTWVYLGLVTSLPAILALVYSKLVEESPQWLVSRGREMEAALVLQRVTIRNNSKHQEKPSLFMLRDRIREITAAGKEEVREVCRGTCGWVIGLANFLMVYPYLSFRIVLVTVCWTVNLILYFITTMKYPYVSDNPYLGWFCTSITEVPANLLMPLLLRCLGRRALHSAGLAVCSSALLTCAALLAAGYKENFVAVSGLVLVTKFCSSMTYLVVYLQAAELHPTPIRSCVTGLASLVALTANIFSPSILAVADPFFAYLLLGALGLIGTLSAFMLPETSGRPLPLTLQEAENFTWKNIPYTSIVTPAREVQGENGGIAEERDVLRDNASPPPPPPPPQPSTSSHLDSGTEESVL